MAYPLFYPGKHLLRILIIGGGGREHALAWRINKSAIANELFACPGNPGIAQLATCLPVPSEIANYADLAAAHQIDLTIVGPEAPLVAGIVDIFQNRNLKIIGPTQKAARLEGSKIFAKSFFQRAHIPTAHFVNVTSYDEAVVALRQFDLPVVLKADGLHGGKGVIIAYTSAEVDVALRDLGPTLVIEEFLEGEEVSLIGIASGTSFIPFLPAQDHKRIFDNDQGPNTGGMGAYTDSRILTKSQQDQVLDKIIYPTLHQLQTDGTPYSGFLYAGLMMTTRGAQILEYNVRLGDPETQAIMHGYEGDFLALLRYLSDNSHGFDFPITMPGRCSVAVTLAAAGYPQTPQLGDPICGLEDVLSHSTTIFQAGTALPEGGTLQTAGGRVLTVTATESTLPAAIDTAYAACAKITFNGMQYRKDIGQKGLKRW